MAIIYKKGQKDLEYTGADKVMKKIGDTATKIKNTAITAAKNSGGSTRPVRTTKKSSQSFGDTLETIKSTVKRGVTAIPRAMDRKAQGDARKEIDNINRAFGSTENYEKLYPETKKRNEELRKRAGY